MGKEPEMRTGRREAGLMAVLVISLAVAGCGGSSSASSNLNSGGDSGGGTGITSIFDSPSEMGVGDIMPVEFDGSTQVLVDFSGVDSGAQFIMAVGSYSESGFGTSMRMTSDLALPEPSNLTKGMGIDGVEEPEDGYGAAEILHAWLRASESDLHEYEIPVMEPAASKAMSVDGAKAASVGSTETFKVLNSITSTSSCVNVTARARCVGDNVVFYIDTSVEGTDSDLEAADLNELCENFDAIAAEEQDMLGELSDKDGDGVLKVLMTKQVNKLGSLGGGIITGYFYAGDLYSESGSNPCTNYGEVIYTMLPDPTGAHGTAISNSFAMSNLLPAVLPHELQHAISYNQHVFVNGGAPEENWLNEGMSHLMEDIMGYNVENPSRYAMYLSSPSSYGLVTQASPNLMERGAEYLFLRFLYEQAADGDEFLRRLIDTPNLGVENLEAAFDGADNFNDFSELVSRWVVALAMTDRGISGDRRYTYRSRSFNSETGNYEGVCLNCDSEDNRGTVLDGVNLNRFTGSGLSNIDAGTAKFYELTTIPDEITLQGTSEGGNFGVLIRTM
jgi:hypothetical protein